MIVTQVTTKYVEEHKDDPTIYRLLVCDDTHGNNGRRHKSLRVKPIANMTIAELVEAESSKDFAFIKVEEE